MASAVQPSGDSSFWTIQNKEKRMSETSQGIQVGQKVPDFELTTYDPVKNDFSSISLASLKGQGKWTILFFYPADFTFV